MKVSVARAELNDCLALLARVVPARPAKEILKAIRVQTTDGGIQLEGNDSENSLLVNVRGEVAQTGSVLMEFTKFRDIIAVCSEEKVELTVAPGSATIVCGGAKFSVGCGVVTEFPAFIRHESQAKITVNAAEVAGALVRLEPFSEPPEAVQWRGLHFEVEAEGFLTIGASNRKMFGWQSVRGIGAGQFECLIPPRAALMMAGVLAGHVGDCQLSLDKATISAKTDRGVVVCRLQEGKFPNWRTYIPESRYVMPWQREAALSAFMQVSVTSADGRMRMIFDDNTLMLSTRGGGEDSVVKVPVTWSAERFDCEYNVEFLKSAVQACQPGFPVALHFKDDGSPCRLESGGVGFMVAALERR